MEDGAFSPDAMLATIDFSLMDELLFDGFWLETTTTTQDSNDLLWPQQQQQRSSIPLNTSALAYCPEADNNTITNETHQSQLNQPSMSSFPHRLQMDDDAFPEASQAQDVNTNFVVLQDDEANVSRLWVGPDRSPTVSVKKKLVQAINHLKDSIGDKDVLIQIWVPVKRGGKQVLTTNNQPFSFNPKCKNLADYRAVSRNFQFAIDEGSKEFTGLPGRVFQKRLPEWTPDVRFFRREEYPRLNHAQQYDVRGSVALPVFQQGSGNCLGVVEIVTTNQQVNYRPELENLCKALKEVDLKSYDFLSAPTTEHQNSNESYKAALAEIRNVLKCVCEAHALPLAQTWGLCSQQGKAGCRHSDENYTRCVSTIDSACYVADPQVSGFHEACSEHHLLKGEGVAGQAFLTNQPCFAQDITTFTKTEYPLAHHARVFNLCAAVAIRLRSTYTETDHDFVLEFFLPLNCKDGQDQKRMLESLSYVIQRTCESLRVVTDQELAQETSGRTTVADEKCPTNDTSSWVRDMMESQRKDGNVTSKGFVSLGSSHNVDEDKDEEEAGGFRVTTQWDVPSFLEHGDHPQQEPETNPGAQDHSGKFFLDTKTNTDKRRSKSEKTISLEVLRQYFAGSLKDAAKNIGVCPTTLKRICRQHGISRWPSRKIQKVGHSLRKLQQVMDTVQGTEGSIQLTSFYNNFPELATSLNPNTPATGSSSSSSLRLNTTHHHHHALLRPTVAAVATASKSPSSSSSGSGSSSSSSSYCVSTALQPSSYPITATGNGDALSGLGLLKRAQSDAELHESRHEDKNVPRSYNQKSLINPVHCTPNEGSPSTMPENIKPPGDIGQQQPHEAATNLSFRVKAAFGEEKIRFSLQPQWGFEELQEQVLKRFNITEGAKVDIKYLDDDSEWVLLTCDADLEECIDIHRSSKNRTVKLSLSQSSYHQHPSLGSSFRPNYGPSY